ncbi:MAG: hypothetical protein WBP34_00415 [Thermoanaerobaculia bacterium]
MSTPKQEHDIEFGGPATYRIVVQGSLGPEWAIRLAGMEITTATRGDQAAHSTLEGPIRDQAELSGVLDTLYGLHLPILKVEKLEEELQES